MVVGGRKEFHKDFSDYTYARFLYVFDWKSIEVMYDCAAETFEFSSALMILGYESDGLFLPFLM